MLHPKKIIEARSSCTMLWPLYATDFFELVRLGIRQLTPGGIVRNGKRRELLEYR
jgi:hypothetical protein